MRMRFAAIGLAVIGLLCQRTVAAAAWPPAASNPKPLPDDLVLPMPCGGEMVFRPVFVPAKDVLDDQRFSMGGITQDYGYKEYQHADYIAGGFTTKDAGAGRVYYLGKYDVTTLQFAALGAACPTANADSGLPQTAISWTQAADFADVYTGWLIANAADKLPHEAGQPGFLRLPTEEEWEYAVRGGARVSTADFAAPLFPMTQPLVKYAWYNAVESANGRLQPIGLLLPNPLGLFDMLGDVSQFSFALFRLNRLSRLHGDAGGYVVRGGNYLTPPDQIRSASRDEFVPYDQRGARHQKTVGFRLALVAPALPNLARLREVKDDWQSLPNAAAGALAEPVQDDPVKEVDAIAAGVDDAQLKRRLAGLKLTIEANIKARDDQMERAARTTLDLATWMGVRMARDDIRLLAAEQQPFFSHDADQTRSQQAIVQRRQELYNVIGPYRDALRTLYTEYPAAVRDAQSVVLKGMLVQQSKTDQVALLDQVRADVATLQHDGDLPDASVERKLQAANCAKDSERKFLPDICKDAR